MTGEFRMVSLEHSSEVQQPSQRKSVFTNRYAAENLQLQGSPDGVHPVTLRRLGYLGVGNHFIAVKRAGVNVELPRYPRVNKSTGILHVLFEKQIECAHTDKGGWETL